MDKEKLIALYERANCILPAPGVNQSVAVVVLYFNELHELLDAAADKGPWHIAFHNFPGGAALGGPCTSEKCGHIAHFLR